MDHATYFPIAPVPVTVYSCKQIHRDTAFIWHVMKEKLFSLPLTKVDIHFGHVRMCATHYPIDLLDNIYIRFGTKLYIQTVGIPMGTNCTPLVADIFLYCYERDFMDSLN